MYIDKKKLVELVEITKNESKIGQADWLRVAEVMNELYHISKSKHFYRSIYRREVNDSTYKKKPSKTHEYAPQEESEYQPKKISIEIEANGIQRSQLLLDIVANPLKTPQEIMRLHGYDIGQWELVKHQLKFWNTSSKQDGTHELYSSSLTVKPIKEGISLKILEDSLKEISEKYNIKENKYEYKHYEFLNKLGIVCVFDLHLGKLGWKLETNNDYDMKIAEKLYKNAVLDLLEQFKVHKPKKLLFPFGNDFFHFDNDKEETTNGTHQDSDTRLPKMWEKGLDLIVWTIEELLKHTDEVIFINVSGNHDYNLSYFASSAVSRLYKDHSRVTSLISPLQRKYFHFGNSLIGFTHGDEEGKRIETIMQVEEAKAWGSTYYHEWLLGHFHSEKRKEVNGLLIDHLSSLSGADKWHYKKGYIGSGRKAVGLVYDYDYGRIAELIAPIRKIE